MENKHQSTIYPISIRHYTGNISPKFHKFMARFTPEDPSKAGTSYEEAFEYIKQKNIELNLTIKNIVYDRGDYYEVSLTQNQYMKFDKDDLPIVQKHVLYADKKRNVFYARSGRDANFQNILLKFTPSDPTIDHVNRDPLDNRKNNLRIATKREQALNRN